MFLLLVLQLAGITGLVFAVVKATQQTDVTAGSPVMTIKGTSTPVQVANSDFYVDPSTGYVRIRSNTGDSAGGSRRHLLQDESAVDTTVVKTASTDRYVDPTSGMMLSNVMTEPFIITSLPGRDAYFPVLNSTNYTAGSAGRRLLQTNQSNITFSTPASTVQLPVMPAPATVLQPICDWASTDLFNANSCAVKSITGATSPTSSARITIPYYSQCSTMTGACSNFRFITKVSVPFFGQGLTPSLNYSTSSFSSFPIPVAKYLNGRLYVPSGLCLGRCSLGSLTHRSYSGRHWASPSCRWPIGKMPRPFLRHPA